MLMRNVFTTFSFVATALAGAVLPRRPEFVPVSPVGDAVSVQSTSGDTRVYFQNPDSSISELGFNAPLIHPHSILGNSVLIPANEVLANTPLTVVTLAGTNFVEIHVYFLSPSNVVSEYFWINTSGWHGGPSCTQCLTAAGFVAAPGTKVLYANMNPVSSELRVGFVSAGIPGTLVEAGKVSGGSWQLGQL